MAASVDYLGMTCDEIRLALSARLDGEDPRVPAGRLDTHLAGCAGCRGWLERAALATRLVRAPQAAAPDLTGQVMAAVAADVADGHRRRLEAARGRRQVLRVAVAVAAVAQLVMAVQVLLSGLDLPGGFAVGGDPHTGREMASFDVALAVGFAMAAYRPERARAFVPVAFVLAACLAATTMIDVANSSTALVQEVGHLVALAQAVLLWGLGRTSAPRPGAPGLASAAV